MAAPLTRGLSRRGGRLVLLLVAAVVPYLNALPDDFVLDDVGLVVRNDAVAGLDWKVLWGADYWAGHDPHLRSGLYRPLTLTTFALQRAVFGLDPLPYHLVNLLLHAAVTVLVWRLFTPLAGHRTAFWGAILFAVLPAHSEAVIAVAGRADLLAALLGLGALCVWQPAPSMGRARPAAAAVGLGGPTRGSPGVARSLAGALLFGLALLSKEQAVVMPVLLAICQWHLLRRPHGVSPGGPHRTGGELAPRPMPEVRNQSGTAGTAWSWGPVAAAGVVLAGYLGLRAAVLGGLLVGDVEPLDNPLVSLHGAARLAAALAVALRYAGLLVLPAWLSADHSLAAIPVDHLPALQVAGGAVLAAGAVWVAWRHGRCPRPWTLAAGWMAAAFAPVLNLFFPIGTIFAERLSYTPSVGFAVGLGWLLCTGLGRTKGSGLAAAPPVATPAAAPEARRRVTLVRAVGLGLVLVYGLRTAVRAADWRDELTLWRATAAVVPASARAHEGLGSALKAHGALAAAEAAYRRAVAIYPRYDTAHYNLGLVLYDTGRYAEALEHFERACRLRPDVAEAHLNRGAALFRLGRLEAARQAYRRALALRPGWAVAAANLRQVETTRRR